MSLKDFAISIAVIHHLSTQERRKEGIRTILNTLKSGGTALVYVWALEQKNSRRGWDENSRQDVMVPWVLSKPFRKPISIDDQIVSNSMNTSANNVKDKRRNNDDHDTDKNTVKQRYYHLYRKGELEHDAIEAGALIVESGYEQDNWWAILQVGGQ